MALQIWLPLTKDLRQQGLSNTTVGNTGATYSSTGGKLGGCYIFDGVDDSLTIGNLSTLVDSEYSFACWFYHDETWGSKSYETLFGGPPGFELEAKNSSTNSPLLRLYSWGGSACTYELNKWNHVVFTRNTTETKLYLNGEPKLTGTAGTIPSGNYFVGSWSSTTGQNYKGRMCDVRIYDHCLSPMEVKKLSQGLVLHYPLNRQGWGQENLLSRYVVPGQAGPTSTAAGGRTTWLGDYKITIPATENADTYFRLFTTKQLTANATYTISCQVSGLKEGSYYRFPLYAQNNTGMGVLQLDHNGLCSLTFTMTYGTQTAATGASGETVYICFMDDSARSIASGQGAITVSDFKLEEGSTVAPWCPNSSDTLATTMGLNSTTEYDCSGFCNNGTRTGTFSWTSDTPKYSVSQYFNGSSYSKTDSGTFSWFAFDKCTVAIWMKPATLPSSWAGTFGIAHDNSSTNKSFVIGNYGGKFTVQSANGSWVNIQASNLPIDEWHHCVATLDGTTIKMYFDGELVNTYTTSWGSTTVASDTRVQVGIDLPGSDEIYQGYYSDARIYATALSADDVKSLYQNCATIDPDGTIRGKIR